MNNISIISLAPEAFILNLGSTVFMCGLIWFVQIVHYPLFSNVGSKEFDAFQHSHQRRTSFVVIGPMTVELFSSLYLAYVANNLFFNLAAALTIAIWLSTFFLQVPLHHSLEKSYTDQAQSRLVKTNWLRTIFWTLRTAMLLWLCANAF